MKITNAIWFTPATGECIGIVLGVDEITGENKAYVGIGEGHDEGIDVDIIAKNGAKFHPTHMEQLVHHFKDSQESALKMTELKWSTFEWGKYTIGLWASIYPLEDGDYLVLN